MAFQPEIYPESWSQIVRKALARANNRCELCHVERGTWRKNLKTNEEYVVYLSVCHRVFYETWKHNASTIVLCQRCHNRFDARFRKRMKLSAETSIGAAKLYVPKGQRLHLVTISRVYVELLRYIDAFLPGQEFEVKLEINSKVVGVGRYQRTKEGVAVIEEDELAEGFSLAFAVLPQTVKPLPYLAMTP